LVAPIVEELAKHYDTKLKVCKLNTEDNIKTPTSLGISAIPTLIIFKAGKPVQRMVGAKSKKDFIAVIDPILAGR
jgi:thioredoxin 1